MKLFFCLLVKVKKTPCYSHSAIISELNVIDKKNEQIPYTVYSEHIMQLEYCMITFILAHF